LPVQIIASGQGWVAGGGVTPSRLRELTGIELPNRGETAAVRHLSDWVSARLSEPLRGGEIITEGSLRVVVRKVRRHKVLEAQIGIDESEPRHH
jgi:putative hemolysin